MAELKALKSTFMNLQKKESAFKLSERTVVDIVTKIAHRGKINLLHTVTGKEYVVDEKVNIEISNEVKRWKSVSVVDLAKSLELPINVVEKKVNLLISRNKGFTLVENKVLTDEFMSKMVIDINKELNCKGSATIAEVASMFDLSINFITNFLKEKTGMDKEIKGKLYPTRILTEDYVEIQKKKIRPALIASISPINISTLVAKYSIDEMLINDIITSMLLSKELKGRFRANEYESEIYSLSQNAYLKEELSQNNYIDYSKLRNIGISQNGKDYLLNLQQSDEAFQKGVFLNDYYVSDILKENFLFSLQENTGKEVPTNMATAFFFIVDYEDTQILLESCGVSIDQYYFINSNLVPKKIIQLCFDEFDAVIRQKANATYKQFAYKFKEKEKKIELSTSSSQKKGKKGKKAKEPQSQIEDSSIEDTIQLPKETTEELEHKLQFNSRFDGINEKKDTVSVLFEKYLLPKLNKQFNEIVINLIKSETNISGDAKTLTTQINCAFAYLKVIQKSLELLMKVSNNELFQSSIKAIMAYLAKKDLVNLMKDVMLYQLLHMKIKADAVKLTTHNERNDFINIYPDEDIRNLFVKLNNFIQNRQVVEFMNCLTENCKILGASIDLINKMKEKAQIESISSALKDSIDTKIQSINCLSMKDYTMLIVDLCNLALCKKGYHLYLPNENWAITLYVTIFSEQFFGLKDSIEFLIQINQIVSMKNFSYATKEKELIVLAKELYNAL